MQIRRPPTQARRPVTTLTLNPNNIIGQEGPRYSYGGILSQIRIIIPNIETLPKSLMTYLFKDLYITKNQNREPLKKVGSLGSRYILPYRYVRTLWVVKGPATQGNQECPLRSYALVKEASESLQWSFGV